MTSRSRFFVATVCVLSFALPYAANSLLRPEPQETAVPAPLDRPLERDLAAQEKHSYSVDLLANEYLHVKAVQRGIDIMVVIFGPDGHQLLAMDSPNGLTGNELASFVASSAGTYLIQIQSIEKGVAAGKYELTVEKLINPSEAQLKGISAQRLFLAAQDFRSRITNEARQLSKTESLALAKQKYAEAVQIWRELKDDDAEGIALLGLEKTNRALTESEAAISNLNYLLNLRQRIGDRAGEGLALMELGTFYSDSRKPAIAFDYFTKARDLYLAINYPGMVASAWNYMGLVHMQLGETDAALTSFTEASMLWLKLNNRASLALALANIAAAHDVQGKKLEAIEETKQALAIFKELNDSRRIGNSLNNLGKISDDLGNWAEALDYYQQSLQLLKDSRDAKYATVLDNMSLLYSVLGDSQKAIDNLQQALSIQHEIKDPRGEAQTLTYLGDVSLRIGDAAEARRYFESALPLRQAASDPKGEAISLTYLGMALIALGQPDQALQRFQDALVLWDKVSDPQGRAFTLDKLGLAQIARKDSSSAVQTFNAALSLNRAVSDSISQAANLLHLAQAERARGNLSEALAAVLPSLQLIESTRLRGSDQQLRTTFLAAKQDYYETAIDILMRLDQQHPAAGYTEKALVMSERRRARSLLDTLAESHIDIRQGVDPQLLEKERDIQQRLDGAAAKRTALLVAKQTDKNKNLADEISNLTADYQSVQAELRAHSPRYAALKQPATLEAAQIQNLLDPDTLLIEFSLGDERSFVWVISSQSVKASELPGRPIIEPLALKVAASLTKRNRNGNVEAEKTAAENSVAALSKILLDPIAPMLGKRRLAIVADGALQLIPFAALLEPVSTDYPPVVVKDTRAVVPPAGALARSRRPRLLIDGHEVLNLASASVLASQRLEIEKRSAAPLAVAVFADPVFDNVDSRVARSSININKRQTGSNHTQNSDLPSVPSAPIAQVQTGSVQRALRDLGINEISPLYFSRAEAESIIKVAPRGQSLLAIDFKANRAMAMSPELSRYRMIHFATHGLLDVEHPELSGILLSMVDESGHAQDGYLRLHDIYNLNLPADLVVLSACETAVGKEIKGEGLIALTRGFMYAGAARVVASLWKVDDAATAELMKDFYRLMFVEHLKPVAALRAAQLKISQQPRWQSPYFWAGFVIQGDWK